MFRPSCFGALPLYYVALAFFVLLAAAFAVGWRYNPFRKFVQRSLDLGWRRACTPGTYPPEVTAAEAQALFVSSTVMRDGCDIIWDEYDPEPPVTITGPHGEGTVIWVNTTHVARFIAEFLPRITGRFVLVTARENNSTAEFDVETALSHPGLIHWFMENYEHPRHYIDAGRITPLPLGLNFHKLDPASPNQSRDMGLPAPPPVQQLDMKAIAARLPPLRDRPLKLYCNFHLNMDTFLRHPHARKRADARAAARDALRDKPFVLWEPRQAPRHRVWARHGGISFEASPRGNSIDCHRTWEALILGSIPIVETSLMDPIYKGLPVAIVKDWREVTEERLAMWKEEFLPWFDDPLPPQLYSSHWIDRFHAWKPAATAP